MKNSARINQSSQAASLLKACLSQLDHEEFWALFLNQDNRVIAIEMLTKGSLNATIIDPRTILRRSLLNNAAKILVAHNHPCGNPTPGPRDIAQTKSLLDVAEIVGVRLFDHIVLGGESFVSIRSLAMLPFAGERHLFIERDNHLQ